MNRTKYISAMLAAGGSLTFAGAADAWTVQTFNIAATTDLTTPSAEVTLAGGTMPQYLYGSLDSVPSFDPSHITNTGDSALVDYIAAGGGFSAGVKTDVGFQIGESNTLGVLSFGQWNQYFEAADPALTFKPSGSFLPANLAYTVTGGPDSTLSGADQYVYLIFTNDVTNVTPFFGTAHISAAGTLDKISYAPIPEPEAWALMVAGVGLAGAGLRRRRRQASANA